MQRLCASFAWNIFAKMAKNACFMTLKVAKFENACQMGIKLCQAGTEP